MFKIEQLKEMEEFKELDDSTLQKFVEISQERGDTIKVKYQAAEEKLQGDLLEVTKELEATKEQLKKDEQNNENSNEGGNMTDEIKALLEKQSAVIETLSSKVEQMETEKQVGSVRSQVLARAKEEGKDLEKTKAYIDRLGDTLSVEEDLSLIPNVDVNSQTQGSSIDDDEEDEAYVSVGVPEFDEIVNGE